MATSLFGNPNDLMRNAHLVVNSSGEIRTEPHKIRGRKPGSKTGQQNQKKQKLRGMGVAKLERLRIEEEKKQIVASVDTSAASAATPNNINATRLLPAPDPVVVLQGFPSSLGGCRSSRIYCGGVGSGQIIVDPAVCSPWSFVETSTHELSSIPNPQIYNASNNRCDTCFKKKRLDGDCNVVRSNGGGFSKYTMIPPPPPPMNGYDHLLQVDQRSHGFFYDHHRISRSATHSSTNPYFNEPTNHTGSMEVFGSYMEANPRNIGSGSVKEYEFFPGKYDDNFPGKYSKRVSVATSVVGDYSPNTSSTTIDLSLKL